MLLYLILEQGVCLIVLELTWWLEQVALFSSKWLAVMDWYTYLVCEVCFYDLLSGGRDESFMW